MGVTPPLLAKKISFFLLRKFGFGETRPLPFFDFLPKRKTVFWCPPDRGWRIGFFNFGLGRVRVLEKIVGSGSGSGISNIFWINWVLSGIENLDRVFPYFVLFNSWSTWLDIKFGIPYYLFNICIHNKSTTIAKGKFSAPNNGKKVYVCTTNRDKSA